jgi:hypothetical protein
VNPVQPIAIEIAIEIGIGIGAAGSVGVCSLTLTRDAP